MGGGTLLEVAAAAARHPADLADFPALLADAGTAGPSLAAFAHGDGLTLDGATTTMLSAAQGDFKFR